MAFSGKFQIVVVRVVFVRLLVTITTVAASMVSVGVKTVHHPPAQRSGFVVHVPHGLSERSPDERADGTNDTVKPRSTEGSDRNSILRLQERDKTARKIEIVRLVHLHVFDGRRGGPDEKMAVAQSLCPSSLVG